MKLIEFHTGGMCEGGGYYNPSHISRIGTPYVDGFWLGFNIILLSGYVIKVPLERDRSGEDTLSSWHPDTQKLYKEYIQMINDVLTEGGSKNG